MSSNAFTGSTTLPVSRNSSTNVIAAITPSTSGSRESIAVALSRLVCAVPASSTGCRPDRDRVQPVELGRRAPENSGAVLPTVRNALPSLIAVAADGGPTSMPSTNVPPGADTDDTSGTCDSSAA